MLSGRKLQVQGSRETTIHEVASEISNLEGVKTTEMQLSHNGKILWDGPRYEIDDEYLHSYLSEVSRDTTVVEDEILTNRCHRVQLDRTLYWISRSYITNQFPDLTSTKAIPATAIGGERSWSTTNCLLLLIASAIGSPKDLLQSKARWCRSSLWITLVGSDQWTYELGNCSNTPCHSGTTALSSFFSPVLEMLSRCTWPF